MYILDVCRNSCDEWEKNKCEMILALNIQKFPLATYLLRDVK